MSLRSSRKRRRRADEQAAAARGVEFGGQAQFLATVREMAEADVLASIPAATLAEIRAADEHPLFVALDIAQEGESTGELVVNGQNAGRQTKLWPAAAIRDFVGKLKDAAVKGIARLWHGASHDDKREVGRPITAFVREIGGKLHAIAVSWIHDAEAKKAFRDGKIDTGSMEADALFERDGSNWIVKAVRAVQGIVLAGQGARPGFPGATVLATVQELAKDKEKDMAGEETLTLRDVQDLIKEQAWTPAQVFGIEALLKERTVVDATATEVKAKVEEAVKGRDEKIKAIESDAAAWKKHEVNQTVGGLIDKSALLKDATKGTAAFVKKALSGRIDLNGVAEAERQKAVDKAITDQLDFIKETGITVPEPKDADKTDKSDDTDRTDKGDKTATRTVGGVEGVTIVGGKDYTDPAVNSQIPK